MRRGVRHRWFDRHWGMQTSPRSRVPQAWLIQTLAVAECLSFYRAANALSERQRKDQDAGARPWLSIGSSVARRCRPLRSPFRGHGRAEAS